MAFKPLNVKQSIIYFPIWIHVQPLKIEMNFVFEHSTMPRRKKIHSTIVFECLVTSIKIITIKWAADWIKEKENMKAKWNETERKICANQCTGLYCFDWLINSWNGVPSSVFQFSIQFTLPSIVIWSRNLVCVCVWVVHLYFPSRNKIENFLLKTFRASAQPIQNTIQWYTLRREQLSCCCLSFSLSEGLSNVSKWVHPDTGNISMYKTWVKHSAYTSRLYS